MTPLVACVRRLPEKDIPECAGWRNAEGGRTDSRLVFLLTEIALGFFPKILGFSDRLGWCGDRRE